MLADRNEESLKVHFTGLNPIRGQNLENGGERDRPSDHKNSHLINVQANILDQIVGIQYIFGVHTFV